MTATPRICMFIGEPHSRHPIVRRQLATLIAAGYGVTLLNPDPTGGRVGDLGYTVRNITPISLSWPGRQVWRVLRRVYPTAGEAWWSLIHAFQVLLTSVPYAIAGFSSRADCYHAHDLYSLIPALVVGKLKGRPIVYDAHELTSDQGDPTSLRNRFERVLECVLVPRVDQVIVPSLARGELFKKRFSLRAEPLVVLNCPPTSSPIASKLLHEHLGLPRSTRVVLYHGTLMPGRALEHLILSARYFEPDTVLVVVGEQNAYFHEVLQPFWDKQRLRGRVYFIPYISPDQMLDYVASADLGVVIYRNINLNNYLCAPTKLYEFLMAGVPVVVSNFPDMLKLLQEYPVGRAFDPEDPLSIAEAVNIFFELEPARREECRQAIVQARRVFTWEHESQKLLSLFGCHRGGRQSAA